MEKNKELEAFIKEICVEYCSFMIAVKESKHATDAVDISIFATLQFTRNISHVIDYVKKYMPETFELYISSKEIMDKIDHFKDI